MSGYKHMYTPEETARTVAFLRELAAMFEKYDVYLYLESTSHGWESYEEIAVESGGGLDVESWGSCIMASHLTVEADKLERGGA